MSAAAISSRGEWGLPLAGVAIGVLVIGLMSNEVAILLVMGASLGAIAAWISWKDLRTYTIGNDAILTIALLGIASRVAAARLSHDPLESVLLSVAVDVTIAGGALFLFREVFFRLKGYDGLGFGDVKLAAAGGALVGVIGFSWALFTASALALAFVAWRRATARPMAAADKLAFGAALAPSLWIVWIAEQAPAFLTLS